MSGGDHGFDYASPHGFGYATPHGFRGAPNQASVWMINPPTAEWHFNTGGTVYGVVTDRLINRVLNPNVYVAGATSGGANVWKLLWDGDSSTPRVVMKFLTDPTHTWASAIELDNLGNIYVLAGGLSSRGVYAFTPDGTPLWSNTSVLVLGGSAIGRQLRADNAWAYVTGGPFGRAFVGVTTCLYVAGTYAGLVSKLRISDGALLWQAGPIYQQGVEALPNGDAVIGNPTPYEFGVRELSASTGATVRSFGGQAFCFPVVNLATPGASSFPPEAYSIGGALGADVVIPGNIQQFDTSGGLLQSVAIPVGANAAAHDNVAYLGYVMPYGGVGNQGLIVRQTNITGMPQRAPIWKPGTSVLQCVAPGDWFGADGIGSQTWIVGGTVGKGWDK